MRKLGGQSFDFEAYLAPTKHLHVSNGPIGREYVESWSSKGREIPQICTPTTQKLRHVVIGLYPFTLSYAQSAPCKKNRTQLGLTKNYLSR